MAKKKSFNWLTLLPLAVGIVMTPVALSVASIMALSGPDALTLLYPWVQVVKSPVLGIPAGLSDSFAQWLMLLQFPVYGLVMIWLRARGFLVAFGAAALLHVVGIGAAILLGHLSNPSLRFF